ncbi:MAG: hypothetical protein AB7H90_19240 [Alphaproteobacteria bacterium]
MRGMIRTLALGAVLAAGATTAAMAQGYNNTGYNLPYASSVYPDSNYYYQGNRSPYDWRGYYGYGDRGNRYNYHSNNYGYGSSYQPRWDWGGGTWYDGGHNRPYYPGYWGR